MPFKWGFSSKRHPTSAESAESEESVESAEGAESAESAETSSAGDEEHELTQRRAQVWLGVSWWINADLSRQNTQSPLKSYPEPPWEWKEEMDLEVRRVSPDASHG